MAAESRGTALTAISATAPRPLRILMYAAYLAPEYSGAALQALTLARQLRARGHHVEFITTRWSGLEPATAVDGFPVQRLEAGRLRKHRELRLWLNMARFVWSRRREFDILHSHGAYFANAFVGPLARMCGLRSLAKVSLARDDLLSLQRPLVGRLHRWMLRQVDACIGISADLVQELLTAGISPRRIQPLPNGVDTERFRPATADETATARATLGLPADRPVALYVGVLDERKNIEWLAQQWIAQDGFGTGALLLAVGPQSRDDPQGALRARLSALARAHPQHFALHDFHADVAPYYQAADLLVLPSHKEGMPNVVLEAMASGLPCVAARTSGSRELIVEGETGFTYAPGDAPALGDAVRRSLSAGAMRLRAASRAAAEQRYSIGRVADRYEAVYRELVPGPVDGDASLLMLTELFLPTKGGTAVMFEDDCRRLGGRSVHIVTAAVARDAEVDVGHPNSIHRLVLARHRWLRPESLLLYVRLWWKALSLAITHRFDAVLAGRALPEGLVAWAVGRLRGCRVVIYAHGEELTGWGRGWKFRAMRFALRSADAVLANSDFTRDTLLTLIGVRPDRIVMAYPTVDAARFRPGMGCDDLRAGIGLRADQALVLSVGRLQRRKGFDQVVRSLPGLVRRGIDAHYALVGIGEDWQYLEDLATELGVRERVHLLGHVEPDDLPRWYNACTLFAMPNRDIAGDTEGFGIVYLEAAACEKPSITGIAGGTGSAVVHEATGLQVDGDDASAVEEGVARLIQDTAFAKRLGAAGRQRVLEGFTPERRVEIIRRAIG